MTELTKLDYEIDRNLVKGDQTVQEKAGKIAKHRLGLALNISHGRWGKTTPKVFKVSR